MHVKILLNKILNTQKKILLYANILFKKYLIDQKKILLNAKHFISEFPSGKQGLRKLFLFIHKSHENNSINYQGYLDPHKR